MSPPFYTSLITFTIGLSLAIAVWRDEVSRVKRCLLNYENFRLRKLRHTRWVDGRFPQPSDDCRTGGAAPGLCSVDTNTVTQMSTFSSYPWNRNLTHSAMYPLPK